MGRDQLSVLDIAMAAENILLSAVDCGLGTCVVKSFSANIIQKILALPGHIVPELMVTVGYPALDGKVPPKRELSELVYFNGWGQEYAEDWNELLAFCITSAIGCMDEPAVYGPLRLIDCMARVIRLGESLGLIQDADLSDLETYIEENKLVCMYDEDAFRGVLQEIAFRLIEISGK